jgi:hypothetical protein
MRSGDPADDLIGGRGLYCGESVKTDQMPEETHCAQRRP